MSKLSLDALKQRAEAVTTEELMTQIGGGTENACHPEPTPGNGGGPIDPNADKYNDLKAPDIKINLPKEPWTPTWRF